MINPIPQLTLQAGEYADIWAEIERILAARIRKLLGDPDQLPELQDTLTLAERILRLQEEAAAIITEKQAAASKELQALIGKAEQAGIDAAYDAIPSPVPGVYTETPSFVAPPSMISRYIEMVEAELKRAQREMGANLLRAASDIFGQLGAQVAAMISTGAATRLEASRHIIEALSAKELPAFVDKAGREWSPYSYAEMVARTTAANIARQALIDSCIMAGIQWAQISTSPFCCDACQRWEGQIIALHGGAPTRVSSLLGGSPVTLRVKGTINEAVADGLFHPNCRHALSPFLPGVTEAHASPEGSSILYQAEQRQRVLERRIRKARRDAAISGEDPNLSPVLQRARQELSHLLAQHPALVRKAGRERPGQLR